MNTVDTAIIGGGPAGAATAWQLAAAGREVIVLERATEPHHKVCGEFLSAVTTERLKRIGIDPSALGATEIDRAAVFAAASGGAFDLPFRAFSLSRYRLDREIIAHAKDAGAEMRRGIAVRSAEPRETGWHLRCSDGGDIHCRQLVLATGKWPLRGLADGRDRSMLGLKMHLQLRPAVMDALAGQVELFLFDRGYAGLQAVEGGLVNLCLTIPAADVSRIGHGWATLRDYLTSAIPRLAEQLDGAEPSWDAWLAVVCPARGFVQRGATSPHDRLYLVGDRLAHIPPFAGDGLAIALLSADLAARHIRQGSTPARYLDEARSRIAPVIRLASVVSRMTEYGLGRALAAHLAADASFVMRSLASRTRVVARPRFRDRLFSSAVVTN